MPGGAKLTDTFAFDWDIVFPTDGGGAFVGPFADPTVRAVWQTESTSAITDWAKWANIRLGSEKNGWLGTHSFHVQERRFGNQHFKFCWRSGDSPAPINYNVAKPQYWDRPYIDPSTGDPDPAARPVASQIRFSAVHEFGHAPGLDDLHDGAAF